MKISLTWRNIIIFFIVIILSVGVFVIVNLYKEAPEPVLTLDDFKFQHAVIGKSVEDRDVEVYTYGKENADIHLLFVGGIHGGYEWNSVLLAYKFIDYLDKNHNFIPDNLIVSIIPSVNPDGVYDIIKKDGRFTILDVPTSTPKIIGTGRFNANGVDLNRNFDCKWKPKSSWQNKIVSAGTEVFSEPEAKAVRDFVLKNSIDAAIFWHSQSGFVYASECEKGILPETINIMNVYAQASGYGAKKSFDAYTIRGDAEGWLASINIPAITIELRTHETVEWEQNLAGIKALFEYYEK